MVIETFFYLFIVFVTQEALSKAQDVQGANPTDTPNSNVDYENSYNDYGKYDYGKQYVDSVKQYDDYVKPVGDYVAQYGDYVPEYGDYAPQYGDYGNQYGDYEFGIGDTDYDHAGYDDYGPYDDYGQFYSYGDRNNPMDTMISVYEETAPSEHMPWVYIIVPVVQVDVFYVGEDENEIKNIDLKVPIDTFFFELGDFGLGHFDLSTFGLGDTIDSSFEYSEYTDFKDYPQYDTKLDMYNTADELQELNVLDYPGIDHDAFWVDWIFMLPPDEIIR